MYKQVQIIVENEFVNLDTGSPIQRPTVFDRAFRKLTQEKSEIGKIFPIFLKIENKHYILGVFTLNRLGSTSLFLELPGQIFFDHITFGKDLTPNKTHLTEVIYKKRKKVTALEPTHLSNDTYHVLTLLIKDFNLLKLAPKKITYPPVDIKYIDLVKNAILTRGGYNGSGICEALGRKGIVVVQLFLIPSKTNFESLNAARFGKGLGIFKESKFKKIVAHKAYLEHEFQNEYQFGLVSYRYNTQFKYPLYLEYPASVNGFYFNTIDNELKNSITTQLQTN